LGDLRLLKNDPLEYIEAIPDETNILVWYFLVKGPEFSDFKDGYYLGKIMHSPEYPFKAPDFMMLTPNGRFTNNKKICLSNSSYHSNEWSAMWNIKSILTGFLSIMLDDVENGISHIHDSKQSREIMAKNSVEYNKENHMDIFKRFTRFINDDCSIVQTNTNNNVNDNTNNNVNNNTNNNVNDNTNNNVNNNTNNNVNDNTNNNINDNTNNNVNNNTNNNVIQNPDIENILPIKKPKKTRVAKPIKKNTPLKIDNNIPKKKAKRVKKTVKKTVTE
jgi:ubiquitin-protein ligase